MLTAAAVLVTVLFLLAFITKNFIEETERKLEREMKEEKK